MCCNRVDQGAEVITEWVFLCLGSNIKERRLHIEGGIAALENGGVTVRRRSSLYETEPVGLIEQPWYLNAVVAGRTNLMPREVLVLCKRIERERGRKKTFRFGPRVLDIDVLLYKGQVVREEGLEIPHPRMHERRFVLVPLLEIAPKIVDPRNGKRFAKILAGLDEEKKVTKLKEKGF